MFTCILETAALFPHFLLFSTAGTHMYNDFIILKRRVAARGSGNDAGIFRSGLASPLVHRRARSGTRTYIPCTEGIEVGYKAGEQLRDTRISKFTRCYARALEFLVSFSKLQILHINARWIHHVDSINDFPPSSRRPRARHARPRQRFTSSSPVLLARTRSSQLGLLKLNGISIYFLYLLHYIS